MKSEAADERVDMSVVVGFVVVVVVVVVVGSSGCVVGFVRNTTHYQLLLRIFKLGIEANGAEVVGIALKIVKIIFCFFICSQHILHHMGASLMGEEDRAVKH